MARANEISIQETIKLHKELTKKIMAETGTTERIALKKAHAEITSGKHGALLRERIKKRYDKEVL